MLLKALSSAWGRYSKPVTICSLLKSLTIRCRKPEPRTRKFLSYQYDTPFIIWCSDKFKVKYPETVLAIQNAIGKPFMIDNLCQLMFHIGALCTKYYHQERDILSSKYIPKTRFVNERRIDYSSVK